MRKRLGLISISLLAAPLLAVSVPLAAATPSAADHGATPPDHVEEIPLRADHAGAGLDSPTSRLEVRFPGQRLSRTLVHWVLAVASSLMERNEHGFYNVRLSGEVRQEERRVDRFDYRFDIPAGATEGEPLALVFDRDLRPGRYQLALEVEDLQTGRSYRTEDEVDVPTVTAPAGGEPAPAVGLAQAPRGAGLTLDVPAPAAPAAAEPPDTTPPPPTVRLLPPRRPVLVGHHRFAAAVDGDGIERVTFLLDDRPVMTKTRPPYNVELDLGEEAEVHKLTVEAWGDDSETPLARDEMMLNTGRERFAVRLVAPAAGLSADGPLTGRCRFELPPGQELSRLEYFVGDRRVALVDRAPFDRGVPLGEIAGPAAVRAVAHLADGRTSEHTVLVGSPDLGERVDVHLVELYTSVVDGRGRAVAGLGAADFRVLEDGVPQRLARLEQVGDLPLNVALVVDVSGSMSGRLDSVTRAAKDFLVAALDERDRAAVVTFDRFPRLAVDFTSDRALLANGLTALGADGGTELHEGLLFALRQFDGVEGQRVVLLFSDGKEESQSGDSDAVLEYARRSGTTVYAIGLDIPSNDGDARDLLRRLARETGGRAHFVARVESVAALAEEIAEDMRSRYLLAYQSSNPSGDGFRMVAVEVGRDGAEARTVRGYYP